MDGWTGYRPNRFPGGARFPLEKVGLLAAGLALVCSQAEFSIPGQAAELPRLFRRATVRTSAKSNAEPSLPPSPSATDDDRPKDSRKKIITASQVQEPKATGRNETIQSERLIRFPQKTTRI